MFLNEGAKYALLHLQDKDQLTLKFPSKTESTGFEPWRVSPVGKSSLCTLGNLNYRWLILLPTTSFQTVIISRGLPPQRVWLEHIIDGLLIESAETKGRNETERLFSFRPLT